MQRRRLRHGTSKSTAACGEAHANLELAAIEVTDANAKIANVREGGSARRIVRGIAGGRSSTSKSNHIVCELFIVLIVSPLAIAVSAEVTGRLTV
jgi:hypothetical protein